MGYIYSETIPTVLNNTERLLVSRLRLLSNLPTTGLNVGHPRRPPRRHLSAVRPSATSVNGRLRSPQSLSSRTTLVSLPRARLLTMLFPLPSPNQSISRTSPSLPNTRSNTRRAATAVVATSSFLRMASKPVERSSLTPLHGLSCSDPISLAREPRYV